MGLDVVAHLALRRAPQAGADAVHLHPTQLSDAVVNGIRAGGIDVHAWWDANTAADLELASALGLPVACTDRPEQALRWRTSRQSRVVTLSP